MKMKSTIFLTLLSVVLVTARPGLLRVPKVYNAVITSDQNLTPSRAYPVIQPVIHRTAIGYVPPFYYTQIAPHFTGPEVVHLPYGANDAAPTKPPEDPPTVAPATEKPLPPVTLPPNPAKPEVKEDSSKKQKENDPEASLSFYPNYRSLYYDPYFYTYNSFNPHPSTGTYYMDYQPYGPFAPVPPVVPAASKYPGTLFPGSPKEEKELPKEAVKDKVPDVPPPPLPTAVPKSS